MSDHRLASKQQLCRRVRESHYANVIMRGNDSVRANQTSSLPPSPGDLLRRWARPERSSRRRRASSWSTTSIFPTSPARCWSACPRTCPGPSHQRNWAQGEIWGETATPSWWCWSVCVQWSLNSASPAGKSASSPSIRRLPEIWMMLCPANCCQMVKRLQMELIKIPFS